MTQSESSRGNPNFSNVGSLDQSLADRRQKWEQKLQRRLSEVWQSYQNPALRYEIDLVLSESDREQVDKMTRLIAEEARIFEVSLTKRHGLPYEGNQYDGFTDNFHSVRVKERPSGVTSLGDPMNDRETFDKVYQDKFEEWAERAHKYLRGLGKALFLDNDYTHADYIQIIPLRSPAKEGDNYPYSGNVILKTTLLKPAGTGNDHRGVQNEYIIVLKGDSELITMLREGKGRLWSFALRNAGAIMNPKLGVYFDAPLEPINPKVNSLEQRPLVIVDYLKPRVIVHSDRWTDNSQSIVNTDCTNNWDEFHKSVSRFIDRHASEHALSNLLRIGLIRDMNREGRQNDYRNPMLERWVEEDKVEENV